MSDLYPEPYTPNSRSATFYVIDDLHAVAPTVGGEARFLHVVYQAPLESEPSGSLDLITFSRRITHPLVGEWVNIAKDFDDRSLGVVRIGAPELSLARTEGRVITDFVRRYDILQEDRGWMIGQDTVTTDPKATRDLVVGKGEAERTFLGIRHDALALASVRAIVHKKLTIDIN